MEHEKLVTTFYKEHSASDIIAVISKSLESSGARIISQNIFSSDVAEIIYNRMDILNANQLNTKHANDIEGLDIITQEYSERGNKKLLVSDMDSTIISCECIDEIADYAGVKDKVSEITERAMNGELDFEQALKERVNLLKGLKADILKDVLQTRIKLNEGAKELIEHCNQAGIVTVLISGGFTFFTENVARLAGFKHQFGNILSVEDGVLSGDIEGEIIGKNEKLQTLIKFCSELGISTRSSIALGDGANDLPMLKAAGLGVAYRAKPIVADAVSAKLNHASLDFLIRVI